ncbi:MAG: hypothetical protein AUJ52_08705 [Elusimicrobia bacterium CG1_02_63_36]|nr:MAG: hypothetical protein AUJ52_08705 [Elusimicrobia bacterium CG1_02_63_36]PIP84605.1 MAG: hypothetical protein COR54_03455 [Elusimicrobia bacterium CG22_combo_CG10-13_8_21_14_all_63_91]PJA17735.1 MAG: hypothetical protein COX66_03485 [Elusimicrobia bacterium CG_4_10_14_0_2_um_filter_63_34]PJB25912.1 MAG: hypothetical protein CO113_06445 [Elusimicrobia bacterium CG_4_9_14_3_um_filter_62_55]
MNRSLRCLAAILIAASPASAGTDFTTKALGTAGSEFLNLDVDPRGIAMGGALTADANDSAALYWNPAGLAQIPRAAASAMHNEYFDGIRMQYASYAQRITETSVLGGAVRYMDAGSIVNTDLSGNTIGTFHPRNYVYEVGWAQNIMDLTDAERDISLGMTAKFFQSDMIAKASSFAMDFGMQAHYTDAVIPYNFGAAVQNIGQGQKFDKKRDTLPFRARLGASIRPRPFLLLVLDGVMPVSSHPYASLGGEMELDTRAKARIFLRGGYSMQNQFTGLDGLRGVSFGLGVKAGNISFDYAFVPFGILGNTHRIGFSWALPPKSSRRFRMR